MRTKIQNDFIHILKAELMDGTPVADVDREGVCCLAKQHQLEHLVSHAFLKNGEQEYRQQACQSIWMSEQQNYVLDQVKKAFQRDQIPFIPLKGAVLRHMYPEAWMRNSCDIDVLIRESDMAKATQALTAIGYRQGEEQTAHDVAFFAGPVCVELHYTLIEEHWFPQIAAVLEQVWDYAQPVDGCEYAMKDEMFYFYHVSHMVKHFRNGGCGVRAFVDLWMLNHRIAFDPDKRNQLLSHGGIQAFAKAALDLAEWWFSNKEVTGLDTMEQYVFSGGVYGSELNRVVVKKRLYGGVWRHFWSWLFVPYAQMKQQYPKLKRHPWLLPFYEVCRWVQAIKNKKYYAKKLKASLHVSPEDLEKTAAMLKDLELL